MSYNYDKSNYAKNLQTALVISLLFFTLFFYISPRLPHLTASNRKDGLPKLILVDIPITRQNSKPKPKPAKPIIPVPSDEADALIDVEIMQEQTIDLSGIDLDAAPTALRNLPFVPRQILEVLPEKPNGEAKGIIVLALRIGLDGSVLEQKVVSNTTHCFDCLDKVIAAARKSRWQTIEFHGQKTEYWIEKTYTFN
jgi:hypothetical protein